MTSSDENNPISKDSMRTSWQTVALLFGFVAPIGYAAAYLREWGFCSIFGIPIEFIQLNVTTISIAITSGVGIIFLLFWLADIFYTLSQQRRSKKFGPIKRRFSVVVIILFLFLVFFVIFPPLMNAWLLLVLLIVFLMFAQFVIPLISQKQVSGYKSKLEAQDKRDTIESKTPGLLDYLFKQAGITLFSLGILIALFLCAMFFVGYNTAEKQTDFLVPSTHQDSVVLRIYGDNLICASFNVNTKEVDKTFFIIKLDDQPRPQLRLVRLGPLKSPKIWMPNALR